MNVFRDPHKLKTMEFEAWMYWDIMSTSARVFYAEGINSPKLDEHRDEIEVLAMYTDWPRLKSLCIKACAFHDKYLAAASDMPVKAANK